MWIKTYLCVVNVQHLPCSLPVNNAYMADTYSTNQTVRHELLLCQDLMTYSPIEDIYTRPTSEYSIEM